MSMLQPQAKREASFAEKEAAKLEMEREDACGRYQELYNLVTTGLDAFLSKKDFEERKSRLVIDMLQILKQFKYNTWDSERSCKLVKQAIKKKMFQQIEQENIFDKVKRILLIRTGQERWVRESAIKLLKKLINFSKHGCQEIFRLKLEVFISFILEREFKHTQVQRERL